MHSKKSTYSKFSDRKEPIYWIGGSSCAGKSTFARQFAVKYGFTLYSCDDHFEKHLQKTSGSIQPAMISMSGMTPNEIFYLRPVAEQLQLYVNVFKEDFEFVIEDILSLPDKPLVIEGNQLMPSLVQPYISHKNSAIWLISNEKLQTELYLKRTWIHSILNNTSNPAVAFDKWMKRDALFAAKIQKETQKFNLTSKEFYSVQDLENNVNLLENHFLFSHS